MNSGQAAGVNAALECILTESDPIPAMITPRLVPRRDPANAVVPIASSDELIETVTSFVERLDDVMEIERILDGMAVRFSLERPADFDKRVAPLRKRIEARSESGSDTVLDRAAEVGVAQAIRHWLEMPPIHSEFGKWRDMFGPILPGRTEQLIWESNENNLRCAIAGIAHAARWLVGSRRIREPTKDSRPGKVYIVNRSDLCKPFCA